MLAKKTIDGLLMLTKEMRSSIIVLDGLPEDAEYTQDDIDNLDNLYVAASKLMDVVAAKLEAFDGTCNP